MHNSIINIKIHSNENPSRKGSIKRLSISLCAGTSPCHGASCRRFRFLGQQIDQCTSKPSECVTKKGGSPSIPAPSKQIPFRSQSDGFPILWWIRWCWCWCWISFLWQKSKWWTVGEWSTKTKRDKRSRRIWISKSQCLYTQFQEEQGVVWERSWKHQHQWWRFWWRYERRFWLCQTFSQS